MNTLQELKEHAWEVKDNCEDLNEVVDAIEEDMDEVGAKYSNEPARAYGVVRSPRTQLLEAMTFFRCPTKKEFFEFLDQHITIVNPWFDGTPVETAKTTSHVTNNQPAQKSSPTVRRAARPRHASLA